MNKIKTSVVSYLNTLPFLYGIEQSNIKNEIDLSLDIPSVCAKKLIHKEVDFGLVPVAILPELKESHIISDFCIGCEGKVQTVSLFSNVPIEEIESIYLDYQSRTSNILLQILLKEFWKVSPAILKSDIGYETKIKDKTAALVIGNRAFTIAKKAKYEYDLGEAWLAFTGLPFVFAAWVSNKVLPESFIKTFNFALDQDVNNIDKAVHNLEPMNQAEINRNSNYLKENISYKLDEQKQKGLEKFLNYLPDFSS